MTEKAGTGERMAADMGVPFLARIPIDPGMVESSDNGKPFVEAFPDTEAARAYKPIVKRLLELNEAKADII
ncbi:MAG: Mrp/NBP35 family ATP-binding protein [Nitrospirales bacterium]|nr:Mrp/NBP35 family ATP-binding protein [Nitrospirales bacterium]